VDQSTIEYREIQRERVRDIHAKKEQMISLAGMLAQLPQERLRTQAELEYESSELGRLKSLNAKGAVTEKEYEETRKEVAVLTAELERLRAKEDSARQQKTQAEEHVRELEALIEQQTVAFDKELTSLRERLVEVTDRRALLQEELHRDIANAQQRRQSKLEQIRLDLEQHRNKIDGLAKTLEVTAPISGQVEYRNPSPGTVYENDPLLIVAPPDAFRFRVRIPVSQANALLEANGVHLELSRKARKGDDVELPPQHLVRRFLALPLKRRQLEHDPTMTLVELKCDPPADAARDLALGEVVRAELVWFPPFFTLPLVTFGMIPLAVGAMGALVAHLRRRANSASSQLAYEPPPANAHLQAVDPDAAVVRLLGEQLGAMIRDGELDPSLLATCEWTLDRHGRKGALLLQEGIRDSGPICEELDRLKSHALGNGSGNGSRGRREVLQTGRLLERLYSLLEVVAPDAVEHEPPSRQGSLARY
jgi:hypothetical protein